MGKLLILIFAGFFAFGCTQSQPGKVNSTVIAKINKTVITKEDFLKEFNKLPEWATKNFRDKKGKEKFLEEIIKRELIYQDAKKKGLHKDKEFLARVEEFKKMSLLSLILEKEVDDKVAVSEAELKNFYDKHHDNFKKGSEVNVSHILVDTREEAEKILERIKSGEDFSELAKSLSKDTATAKKGGGLGFITRGQMVPAFEHVAFKLEAGEVSKPVKTKFGYHIIKVVDKKEGTLPDFEDVKNLIRRQLLTSKKRRIFDSYIEDLERKNKITKNLEALATISLPR